MLSTKEISMKFCEYVEHNDILYTQNNFYFWITFFKKVKLILKFYYSFRFFEYKIVILQDTTKL